MIAVDTSALMAILRAEPEADQFLSTLLERESCLSAGSVLELCIVASRWRPKDGDRLATALLDQLEIKIVTVDASLSKAACEAFLMFGKGRHPAALNFGDCFSYALAKSRDLPLLFKGDDFAKTDIRPALA